ncbi:MAG TPA: HIT domain-containing protein [Rhodanobacteraceae bacterium]|nr:HIT domain-containing protein [Rhodanobacteraceae bacterium]
MSDPHDFTLDPRLAAGTVFVANWKLCRVLLMDDARFPWLILVPRRTDLVELDDLAPGEQAQLLSEINRAMATLRNVARCDKINVGALGNIVRQLHVHVLARREGDPAWPGPLWGIGNASRYGQAERERLLEDLHKSG